MESDSTNPVQQRAHEKPDLPEEAQELPCKKMKTDDQSNE